MKYYLDTNICVFFLRGKLSSLLRRVIAHKPSDIKIPSIVAAELQYGAKKSLRITQNMEQVEKFLSPFEIIPFDMASAQAYGGIRVSLEKAGQIIGPNDLIIASTVISRCGTLVTNNIVEFSRVKHLEIEDWTS
jgi:tRNA(fMet)-specific endonuclease VapC